MDVTELQKTVIGVSNQAFELAQQAVQGRGDQNGRMSHARELNTRLDELLPQVQNAPANIQPTLSAAWTDARLDIGYVLSNGTLPGTSTRLHYFLEDFKRTQS